MTMTLLACADSGTAARQRSESSVTATTRRSVCAAPAFLDQGAFDGGAAMTPLDEAKRIAAGGIPVFPCYPEGHGTRPDGRPYYKSPRITGWPLLASTDIATIRQWWEQWPDSLVGVPTGQRSGLYVLDLDVKPAAGVDGAASLRAAGIVPPVTRINHTLTGGQHLLYQLPTTGAAKTDAGMLGAGIDRRGDGGYIIWWPAHGGKVTQGVIADCPQWMVGEASRADGPDDTLPPMGLTDVELHDLLRRIPPESVAGRSEWLRVGMALHHETGGDERGLVLWNAYSMCWPKYDGEQSLRREWGTFGRTARVGVTLRSYVPSGWRSVPPDVAFAGGVVLQAAAPRFRVPNLPLAVVDARDGTATSRPLTEAGNAMRLFDQHGADLRYVFQTKGWVYWSNGAWHWDMDGAVPRQLAANLAPMIYQEGAENIQDAELYAKWARKTQELKTVRASVSLLADMEALRVAVRLLDNNIMQVGLDGARMVLDLPTGLVRPAVQSDYITKSLGVREVGNIKDCPRWLKFLDQVFDGDCELIDWIQRWCGYTLTGSTVEQFFCFAFGTGRNGKGTFAETLKYIAGDYARIVAPETLTEAKRAPGAASPDVVALAGARLVLSAETNDGSYMAEGLIKTLTGGDTITARPLFGSQFEFLPQFKLLISGNHKPVIKGVDYAIWARVRLIPFTITFSDEDRDPQLQEKLRAEAPHILAWMVAGCLKWQEQGLQDVPAVVKQATQEYKADMDIIGAWIEERAGRDPTRETVASSLYQNYRSWALDNGYKAPMTNQAFGRRLSDMGFKKKRTGSANCWIGIYIIV